MHRFDGLVGRLRSLNPWFLEVALALLFTSVGLGTVFAQPVDQGMQSPGAVAALTAVVVSGTIVFRRRAPLFVLAVSSVGVVIHLGLDYPEGSLSLSLLFLTYSVGTWAPLKIAFAGLALVSVGILAVLLTDAPGFSVSDAVTNFVFFCGVWAIGFAVRARRETLEARVREAEERANVERQRSGRVLAEERLRLAQELHDVVAHSMSVIAVQAGAGAHVLDHQPDQARAALEAISQTSRGALGEMRRLLGVLRDDGGERLHKPAPVLADLPSLVQEVRAAGVPVTLTVEVANDTQNPALELSAYRIVQEALTNVIKHAGSPSRVDVSVRHVAGALVVEVVDDGRGAATAGDGDADNGERGHGLLGMRERVELWGGELHVGPVAGGGYGVRALLPFGTSP